ncbi:peptidoglycan DD-metalloendopeptidase family protein [Clostridium sp. YIM B02505]|uniref:Peptidoglycan DD-metalloendopeptidase family protein n=1 Tax=Clostridium yunnanense TaxID=2800325 RepID=A0ABS1EW77_9CLOT|nr:M23 family metallopeptidase [Clostridium yunnanense]MBK1813569.1 peptidoglycan DD-metalloendopeptidase family protein [Clostridium yunnanense]
MKKKILSLILCFFITSGFNSVQAIAATTDSLQNQINSNKDKIDDLEDQKDQIKDAKNQQSDQLKTIQDQLDKKVNDLKASQTKVDTYQGKIDNLQGKINSIQSNINKVSNEIGTVQKSIEEKKQEEIEKKELLGKRLRNAYKISLGEQLLGVVLGSDDLNDFIEKITTITTIIEKDNELIEEVKDIQKDLTQKEKDLSAKKADMDAQKNQVLVEQNELKDTQQALLQERNENKQKYDELSALRNQKNSVINSLSDSEKQLAEKIDKLEEDNKDTKDEIDRIIAGINSKGDSDTSNSEASKGQSFIWPASGPITDPFGPRVHPTKHIVSFHTGLDIGAPMGANVKASKSGTVVVVETKNVAYGHMIIIDHGNGVQTMYGHMRSVNVSVGQKVSQGQVIASVGSEGYSTGPHLHFEIRIGGQAVNPAGYLGK